MDWTHLDNEAKSIVVVTQPNVQKALCFFGNIPAEISALSLHFVDELSGEKGG
jgi:hypothetical protein